MKKGIILTIRENKIDEENAQVRFDFWGDTYPIKEELKADGYRWEDGEWTRTFDVKLADIAKIKAYKNKPKEKYNVTGVAFEAWK